MLALLKLITSPLFKILALVAVVVALLFGTYHTGYTSGINEQKSKEVVVEKKADAVVVDKNVAIQGVADTSSMAVIVYRDRVDTKYKTIREYITTYAKTPSSNTVLDVGFVRLHDSAASSATTDSNSTTGSASGPASNSPVAGTVHPDPTVTTGQAIGVISDNYKEYAICREKVIQWNKFYGGVKDGVNK